MTIVYRCAQAALIFSVRPYLRRELPGWGKIFGLAAGYHRDWLWRNCPARDITGRVHGYKMRLDLTKWSDRATYFLGRWSNLELQLLLRDVLQSGDTVIDVGANRGNFALCASRFVGSSGKVICFEPNPYCASLLRDSIATNSITNILIEQVALGDQEGTTTLSVPSINSGEGTLGTSRYPANQIDEINVPLRRGDRYPISGPLRLIKLDVEGYEPFVLRGYADTIYRTRPLIVTEVISDHLAACGSSIEALASIMRDFGYTGFRLTLAGSARNRTWGLSPFTGDDGCDVVWSSDPSGLLQLLPS